MSLRWVCEVAPGGDIRLGTHLAFQWRDCPLIRTACGLDLDERDWVDADEIVAPTRPPLIECPTCAGLTVREVGEAHGRWMRDENP